VGCVVFLGRKVCLFCSSFQLLLSVIISSFWFVDKS
jgi:hypothetical protein